MEIPHLNALVVCQYIYMTFFVSMNTSEEHRRMFRVGIGGISALEIDCFAEGGTRIIYTRVSAMTTLQ